MTQAKFYLAFSFLFLSLLNSSPVLSANWQDVIRGIPYKFSKGFYNNLSEIRNWVLLEKGFCEHQDRHILFNSRGAFLGYIGNLSNSEKNQVKINQTRHKLHQSGKVKRWIKGSAEQFGYPFALNCNQPHVNIDEAIKRLLGKDPSDLLWGTWDGMTVGSKSSPVSLDELVEDVYKVKSNVIKQPVIATEFRLFLAQIIIESGAQKHGLSKANAIGMLQLKPSVLNDCQIPPKFYRHRMAQVDCAVRLFYQNRRNLTPTFNKIFGHLPRSKRDTLFSMLLVQSYHSGIGRISRLLDDPMFNQAALHFSQNHDNYSAEDIATGIIYHNLGRNDLGFASLYYVVDVALTAKKLCYHKDLKKAWFCKS